MDYENGINILLLEVRESFSRLRATLRYFFSKHGHNLSKWAVSDLQFVKSKYDSCLAYSSSIGCFEGYVHLKSYLQNECLEKVYDRFIKYWI